MNEQAQLPLPRPAREAIELRPAKALVPHARNPRTHTKEQIAQVAESIRRFRWTNPVLIDERDGIVAGHGRVLAAHELYKKGETIATVGGATLPAGMVPVIVARGWTDAEKRAYVIADNKLALNAGWDNELLKIELAELKGFDFDLSLTGFYPVEIAALYDEAGAGAPADLTEDQRVVLRTAWRAVLRQWRDDIARDGGLRLQDYSRAAMGVYFVNALVGGGEMPRLASLAYAPHRVFISGDVHALADLVAGELTDSVVDSIIWAMKTPNSTGLCSSLPIHGHRMPADFPAALARDLIDEFSPADAAILDPCHGWGGRLCGFLLSRRGRRYVGFDTDERTNAGVRTMFADLAPLAMAPKEAELACLPFEDAALGAESFDFALTSPPYYDVEKYDGAGSSWRRYSSFRGWLDGFFRPLIEKTAAALQPGACFALQVGNQAYPLEKHAREIARSCGLTHIDTRITDIFDNRRPGKAGEVVVLLRKRGR